MDEQKIRDTALHIITEIIEKPPWRYQGTTARRRIVPPPISSFKRLEPLGFGIPDEDWWVFDHRDFHPETLWPLSVGYITDGRENAERDPEYSEMVIKSARTIAPAEARGLADRFSRHMVRVDMGHIFDGELAMLSLVLAWLGGQWTPTLAGTTVDDDVARQPQLAQTIAFRQRYEWAVSVGLIGKPSVRFSTDATGMKDLFAIRDLPEGRDRRTPLMNWVSDHWRRNRSDPDIENYVRKSMRGNAEFRWHGLDVEILPAQFDIEQIEKEKEKRRLMRAAGTDKRPAKKSAGW